MRLTALENTPIDFTANVKDDFIHVHGLTKGQFNSISSEQAAFFQDSLKPVMSPGGSAANVCHGFANLGLESVFIGSIGNDENGEYYANELSKAGVISYLEKKNGATGRCLTLITYDKERTFAMDMGESSALKPWDFEKWLIQASDIFHTTAYALDSMYWTVRRAMSIAKRNKVMTSFDLASVTSIQRHKRKIRKLLNNVDFVFANEEEAMTYTGADNPYVALDMLASDRMAAVVKMGSKGAMAKGFLGSGICAAYSVSEVKNTNGAGDAAAAGFLYGIAKGCSIQKSLQIGAFYAARVVEVEQARLPYRISNIEELI